jgi:hypothetical protein
VYWDDLKRLIRRNAHPHSIVKFYPPNKLYPHNMTICDMNLPRRRGLFSMGWTEHDWVQQSAVCVCYYENNEIPLRGWIGEFDNTGKITKDMARGALAVLDMLIESDVLVMTEEVRNFLREHDGLYRRRDERSSTHRNLN